MGTPPDEQGGPGRLSLLGGTPSRGSHIVASAGTLGVRVPTPTLALASGECQGGPAPRLPHCPRGPRRLPVAADRRGPGSAGAGRGGDGRGRRGARSPVRAAAYDAA